MGHPYQVVLDAQPPGEPEVQFLRQRDWGLLAQICQRQVGEQAEDFSTNFETDMAAPANRANRLFFPSGYGPAAYDD